MTHSFTYASEDRLEHRRKMMPIMTKRASNRVRDEIDEGMNDYADERIVLRNVRRCGTVTAPVNDGQALLDFGAFTFPRGSFPLYIYSAGWKAPVSKPLCH